MTVAERKDVYVNLMEIEYGTLSEEELVEAWRRFICSKIRRIFGHFSHDYYQEAVIALLENYKKYDPDRGMPLYFWLNFSIRNRLLNLMRTLYRRNRNVRSSRRRVRVSSVALKRLLRVPDHREQPLDAIYRREDLEFQYIFGLDELLTVVKPEIREVMFRVANGELQRDIGKEQGVGRAAIGWRIRKAIADIRKHFDIIG